MSRTALVARELGKDYGDRVVIRPTSFELEPGDVMAVTGENGSGKSTLMRMLAGVLMPSTGDVDLVVEDRLLETDTISRHLGFVAPYITLYTEFTAAEHVELGQSLRGLPYDRDGADEMFARFGLERRIDDRLSDFSSGMAQRVKVITATIHNPPFLLLDEPTTNLDTAGIAAMRTLVESRRAAGGITIIATNDPDDLSLCTMELRL